MKFLLEDKNYSAQLKFIVFTTDKPVDNVNDNFIDFLDEPGIYKLSHNDYIYYWIAKWDDNTSHDQKIDELQRKYGSNLDYATFAVDESNLDKYDMGANYSRHSFEKDIVSRYHLRLWRKAAEFFIDLDNLYN